MKRFTGTFAATALMLLGSTSANAVIYQIQMGGLNLNYNEAAGTFCDSGGGVACNAAADPLITMTFLADGNLTGILAANIGLNMLMYITAATDPFLNATHNLLNAGDDIFDAQINGVPGLFTDVTSGSITFSNNSVNATGTGFSDIFAQNLPFGWNASDPINWSFSSGLGSCTGAVGQRVCTYAGTGELSWETEVPEPGTLLLLGSGLIGLGLAVRRRPV